MTATTIKVSTDLRDRLNEAAREEGMTTGSFVEELLELHLRERRFARLRAALASSDEADRASHEAEAAAWDATLGDGLAP